MGYAASSRACRCRRCLHKSSLLLSRCLFRKCMGSSVFLKATEDTIDGRRRFLAQVCCSLPRRRGTATLRKVRHPRTSGYFDADGDAFIDSAQGWSRPDRGARECQAPGPLCPRQRPAQSPEPSCQAVLKDRSITPQDTFEAHINTIRVHEIEVNEDPLGKTQNTRSCDFFAVVLAVRLPRRVVA